MRRSPLLSLLGAVILTFVCVHSSRASISIVFYDGAEERSIVSGLTHYYGPQTNNKGDVAWTQRNSQTSSRYDLFVYDGTSVTRITGDPYENGLKEPSLYKMNNSGHVVWQADDGTDYEIFLYDGTSTTRITDNSYDDGSPEINDNGWVVWVGQVGSVYEIFLYDGTSTTQITNNLYSARDPDINDSGHVTWSEYDGSDSEIFLYDGTGITQITDNSSSDFSPQIGDNGYVAWRADFGISLYDGTGITEITSDHVAEMFEMNNSGHVVWTGGTGGGWEIFFYDGASTTQLTNNDYVDMSPRISDQGASWIGYNNIGLQEIFVYDGTSVTMLTNNMSNEYAVDMSDDGKMVWIREHSEFWSLATVDGARPEAASGNLNDLFLLLVPFISVVVLKLLWPSST